MSKQISRRFIDELMTRVDIVDVIDNYVQLKKVGQRFTACCPFHNEKTPSFIVYPKNQDYHCFGCQAHGNVFSFLMNYANFSFVDAVHELATHAGIAVVYEAGDTSEETSEKTNYYELMTQVATYYQTQLYKPENQQALDYLKARGLETETIKTFGLGYAPDGWHTVSNKFGDSAEKQAQLLEMGLIVEKEPGKRYDRFRHRIIFPIHDRRGRTIAFGGRVLDESKPKYLNSPETPLFQKGRELYGWHWLRKKAEEQVLVVEGYMDVVMLAQYEVRNAVATLGTAVTPEHLKQLFNNFAEVIFCFDDDEAGNHAAWRTLEISLPLLRDSCAVKFMFFSEGDDPDSRVRKLGTEQFKAELEHSRFLSNYLFEVLEKKVNMRSIEGRTQLVELAKPFLQQLSFSNYQQLLLQTLSERSGINIKDSTAFTNKDRRKLKRLSTPSQQHSITRSLNPIPKIIRFLLYQPTLAKYVQDTQGLTVIREFGINLLVELLEFIKNYPHLEGLTSAIICQHWADTAEATYLYELVNQEMLLTQPEVIQREFMDLLALLYRLRDESINEERLNFLYNKNILNEQEKQELRMLEYGTKSYH